MEGFEHNIPSVSDYGKDKKLITADFKGASIDEYNPTKECLLPPKKFKELESKIKNLTEICQQQDIQINATHILERLQNTLNKIEEFDDIDLIYDPKFNTYRFRLYDQNELIIPVDVSMKLQDNLDDNKGITQLEKLGQFIINIMNHIDEVEFKRESGNISFVELNGLQEIVAPHWLLDKKLLATDDLKNIFNFNPNDGPMDHQANRKFNQIWKVIQQAQQHRKHLSGKGIQIK